MATHRLLDLPYDYGALEPHISGQIMQLPHDRHHNTYVNDACALPGRSTETPRPQTPLAEARGLGATVRE